MDVHLSEGGLTTADKVHKREEFRLLIADVQDLPETQRTALLLREIDALSYEQIAEAMETTVPSVKSLLVRARVSLAEAAEARLLSCDEVRVELGAVSEGLMRTTAPVRRHLRTCDRCGAFQKQLRQNNRALAALYPVGPLFLLKKMILAQLGTTAAASGSTAAAGGGAAAAGAAAGGALQAGMTTLATKAVAGLAAAAIVTAGAVEVKHVAQQPRSKGAETTLAAAASPKAPEAVAAQSPAPVTVRSAPQPAAEPEENGARREQKAAAKDKAGQPGGRRPQGQGHADRRQGRRRPEHRAARRRHEHAADRDHRLGGDGNGALGPGGYPPPPPQTAPVPPPAPSRPRRPRRRRARPPRLRRRRTRRRRPRRRRPRTRPSPRRRTPTVTPTPPPATE